MINIEIQKINDYYKGLAAFIVGIIFVLHGLGLFQAWLDSLFGIIGIALIIYGVIKTDGIGIVKSWINARRKSKPISTESSSQNDAP